MAGEPYAANGNSRYETHASVGTRIAITDYDNKNCPSITSLSEIFLEIVSGNVTEPGEKSGVTWRRP
jgi:hypothetical protein